MLAEELLLPLSKDEWEETGEAARVLGGIVHILGSKVDSGDGAKRFSPPPPIALYWCVLPRVQLKIDRRQ